MATSNLEILIAARNTADAELAKLNKALRDAGSTTKVTATNAGELMKELRGAEKAQREIDKLDRYIKQLGGSADQSKGKLGGLMSSLGGMNVGGMNLGMLAGTGGAALAAGAGLTFLIAKAGEAADNASALTETISKSGVVFGTAAAQVERFGNSAAGAIGQSKQQAMEASASFGAMFNTVGLGQAEAAKMSMAMTKLGSDMASFNNRDPSEMLDKIRSGLAGEAEPLRQFGVLLSEGEVKLEAYRRGIAAAGAELTEAQKVQARYSLILSQTTLQQGDFARTADQAANSQRILDARTADLSARFGAMTLPIRTGVITALNDLVKNMDDVREQTRRANDMISAGTPVSLAYAQAAREIERGLDGEAAAADRAERGIRGLTKAMSEYLDQAPVDVSALAAKAAAASDLADSFVQINSQRWAVDSRPPIFTPQESADASDLADSFNRVSSAAGLMANTENKAEAAARALTDAHKAETEANKARTEAMQRATSAVQGLQSAINDLNRTPLLGQGAFDEKQAALQARIDQIDAAQRELVRNRGSRTQLRALAKERADLESQLGLSESQERAVMGPQQRELQKILNPSLPEMSLQEILTRAAGAKAGLLAAQSYQTSIQQTNTVSVTVEAGGRVTTQGGDAALGEAIGEAVNEALRQFVAGGTNSMPGASPLLAGAR